MTQTMQISNLNSNPEAPVKYYVPLHVPVCLQFEGWFLSGSIISKSYTCSTQISSPNLFLLLPLTDSSKIVIQSMVYGTFLDSEGLIFKNHSQNCGFFYATRSHQDLSFETNSYRLIIKSEGCLVKDTNHSSLISWKIVFPGIPLLKSLSNDFCLHKTTEKNNKMPYDVPLYLQSYKNTFLGFEASTGKARCLTDDLSNRNTLLLRQIDDHCVAIELRQTGVYLSVHANGKCGFTSKEIGLAQKFDVKIDSNANIIFTSCMSEKIMGCDSLLDAHCKDPFSKSLNLSQHLKWKLVLVCSFNPPLKPSEKKLDYTQYCD